MQREAVTFRDILLTLVVCGLLGWLATGCAANHYVTVDTGADIQDNLYPYAGVSYATEHPCTLSVGWWAWVEHPSVNGPYVGVGCSWTIWSKETEE